MDVLRVQEAQIGIFVLEFSQFALEFYSNFKEWIVDRTSFLTRIPFE
jgi:hypothetical protein